MKEILIYALGVAVCSGLLVGFYRLALYRRTSFRTARIFIAGSLAASALIPAFNIPVWRAEAILVPAFDAPAVVYAAAPAGAQSAPAADIWQIALWAVYAVGVAALLAAMAVQAVKIRRLKRRAEVHGAGGYDVAISAEVTAPFSFLSTVYVAQGTPPEETRQIIMHETSHIRHRHSVEKIIMEMLKTLMWFNPFAWTASRLLNEVHEFEADRDVLHGGCTVEEYLPVIFRQAFGYVPEISTGMADSLTKKRFEMMSKNLKHKRYSWLRAAGAAPIAAAMLMLFGFTQRPQEIVVQKPDTKGNPAAYTIEAKGDTTMHNAGQMGSNLETDGKGAAETLVLKGDLVAIEYRGAKATETMQARGGGKPFMWLGGSDPRELTEEDVKNFDADLIESLSVIKAPPYPEEVVEAMGGRKYDGVIVIKPKEDNSKDSVEAKGDSEDDEVVVIKFKKDTPAITGNILYWLGNEEREMTKEEAAALNVDNIEAITVIKKGKNLEKMLPFYKKDGDNREIDEIMVITMKK